GTPSPRNQVFLCSDNARGKGLVPCNRRTLRLLAPYRKASLSTDLAELAGMLAQTLDAAEEALRTPVAANLALSLQQTALVALLRPERVLGHRRRLATYSPAAMGPSGRLRGRAASRFFVTPRAYLFRGRRVAGRETLDRLRLKQAYPGRFPAHAERRYRGP